MALSFGLSIAIVSLIGFGLNFTELGITLEPLLYSIGGFIIVASIWAMIRRAELTTEERAGIELSLWPGKQGAAGRVLSLLLVILILGSMGLLGYVVANPQVEEPFTEFFVLGLDGSADYYPSEFIIVGDSITRVSYGHGDDTKEVDEQYGRVTLVIINNEGAETNYTIRLKIDGEPAYFIVEGDVLSEIGPLSLGDGQEWQQEVGFAPVETGQSQKVEFILYKDSQPYFENPLYIWIDVTLQ